MHLCDPKESTNLVGYEFTERFYGERLNLFRRNYGCFSIDTVSSCQEIALINSHNLISGLYTKSSVRTVKDKEFIPTMR